MTTDKKESLERLQKNHNHSKLVVSSKKQVMTFVTYENGKNILKFVNAQGWQAYGKQVLSSTVGGRLIQVLWRQFCVCISNDHSCIFDPIIILLRIYHMDIW